MAGKKKRKQSDFKPRDGNLDTFGQFVQKSESENSGQNDFQSQRQTFGQKVQKLETENKEQTGSDVFREEKTFAGECQRLWSLSEK